MPFLIFANGENAQIERVLRQRLDPLCDFRVGPRATYFGNNADIVQPAIHGAIFLPASCLRYRSRSESPSSRRKRTSGWYPLGLGSSCLYAAGARITAASLLRIVTSCGPSVPAYRTTSLSRTLAPSSFRCSMRANATEDETAGFARIAREEDIDDRSWRDLTI